MKELSNDKITIQIADHGAELISICANETEYLWQADPQFWGRHSPVLFPIVGRVWNNTYRHEGKTYSLGQHGFARANFCMRSPYSSSQSFRTAGFCCLKASSSAGGMVAYHFPALRMLTCLPACSKT